MLPALAQALAEEAGVDVHPESFRLDAVPAYLRTGARVVGQGGQVLGQGKDARDLWERFGASAREVWKQTAAPNWERKGLTSWDFGDLLPFLSRRVAGADVRTYPAIVDRGTAVDLALLESAAAAEAATRGGLRRLVMLSATARGAVSAIAPRIPRPFSHASGAPTSRAEADAFRALVLARIVDDAFSLQGDAPLPRTRRAFEELVANGAPRVAVAFRLYADAVARVAADHEAALAAVQSASKHPGAKLVVAEARAHLEQLLPPELLGTIAFGRLEHLPRYLRAVRVRVERAIADPRKDAEKLGAMAPAWDAFLKKRASARDREAVEALRWSFEELRVAIFAPELKTAMPVSAAKVAAAVAALR
jgi:ATP-dependent helicase HrpA